MRYTIHEGDNLEWLRAQPDNSIDSVCTDPPYGLGKEPNALEMLQAWIDHDYLEVAGAGFMGRKWDAFVPQPIFWKEVYRVLKPGGHVLSFAGTRTYDWMVMAIRLAGFEIRDQLIWMYACLSEDTEILTETGWQKYRQGIANERVLCYISETKEFIFAHPTYEHFYKNEHPAYRIQSDHTDQIVSRNHRVLVERSGSQVFIEAQALQPKEVVPFLESLHDLPESIPMLDKGASIEKRHLLQIVRKQEDRGFSQGCIIGAASSEGSGELCHLWEGVRETGYLDAERPALLQPTMQRKGKVEGLGKAQPQGRGGVDKQITRILQTEKERPTKPCLEGRGNIRQVVRELCRCEVCTVPTGIPCDGSEGWVCNGASFGAGSVNRQGIGAGGGSASREPQPKGQPFGELDAVSKQLAPQAIRGTAATITEIEYNGNVWCVTVPTGAFVARRSGKIFITGNSGFPKSHDISKGIDKQAGAERKVVGAQKGKGGENLNKISRQGAGDSEDGKGMGAYGQGAKQITVDIPITAPATPEAQKWDGWGTALSPSHEPIVLARKPLEKGLTIAQNVLKWGTGALNIDGCRVGTDGGTAKGTFPNEASNGVYGNGLNGACEILDIGKGRWPSNLIHDGSETVEALFPQTGVNGIASGPTHGKMGTNGILGTAKGEGIKPVFHGDAGSASRYFYCAKPSQYERSLGVTGVTGVTGDGRKVPIDNAYQRGKTERKNIHPTVKPVALMHHLVTLITPPNAVCLDPFCGSGTTGIGAMLAGPNIRFIGLEFTPEYIPIIEGRMANWAKYRQFIEPKESDSPAQAKVKAARASFTHGSQQSLFGPPA